MLIKYTILLLSAFLLCLGPVLPIEVRRVLFFIFIPSVIIVTIDFFREWYRVRHVIGLPLRLLESCDVAFHSDELVIRKRDKIFTLSAEKMVDVRIISSAAEIADVAYDLENVVAGALVGAALIDKKKRRATPKKHNMLIIVYERDLKNTALVLYLRRHSVTLIQRLIRPYVRQCKRAKRRVAL